MNPLTLLCSISFFIFLSTSSAAAAASTTTATTKKYKTYLKSACSTATFPKECYSSLSPYASKIKTSDVNLIASAISVSLKAARETNALVSRLLKSKSIGKDGAAVLRDCAEEITDTIDELRQSNKALSELKRKRRVAQGEDASLELANMRTWLSAAITDETTCTDGFEGASVSAAAKEKVGKSVKKVGKFTSNALALVDKLSYY
ncbi:Pectinesterase inhibitor 4 [Linum grandiflorum]